MARLIPVSVAAACGLLSVVLFPAPALACSEEYLPETVEEVDTVVEWLSTEIGWADGERAAVLVPVRYWGRPPSIDPVPFVGRSADLRYSVVGPDDCQFYRDQFVALGATNRVGLGEGGEILSDVAEIEAVLGRATTLDIDEEARREARDGLDATRFQSLLYWRIQAQQRWPWAVGLVGEALGVTAARRRAAAVSSTAATDDRAGDAVDLDAVDVQSG